MAFHQIHLSVFLQDISNNNLLLHNYIPAIPDHLGVALVTPNLLGQSPNLLRPYTITGGSIQILSSTILANCGENF